MEEADYVELLRLTQEKLRDLGFSEIAALENYEAQ